MTRQATRQAVHVRMCVCTYTAVAHEQTIFVAMCNRLKTELTDCQQLYPGRTHCLLTPLSPFLSLSPLAIRISHTTIILSVNTLVRVICNMHTCRQRGRGRIMVPNPLKCDVHSCSKAHPNPKIQGFIQQPSNSKHYCAKNSIWTYRTMKNPMLLLHFQDCLWKSFSQRFKFY